MSSDGVPLLVRALHAFRGANNDELVFAKGDVITVTQQPEGGWWEGTLGDHTAWFPSNYVQPLAPEELLLRSSPALPGLAASPASSNRSQYRAMVLADFIGKEEEHVRKLHHLLASFIRPLLVERAEFTALAEQLSSLLAEQVSLLETLKAAAQEPSLSQRVGGEMLARANAFRALHRDYARLHPAAIEWLQSRPQELDAFLAARAWTKAELISHLSLPFRHLGSYPTTLQELERNMEESQADRGDTQRAVEVYRRLLEAAEAARQAGEMELELLERPELSSLRPLAPLLLFAGCVEALDAQGSKLGPRTALLFRSPPTLILLERSLETQSYGLKERLPLQDTAIARPPKRPKELGMTGAELSLRLSFGSQEEAGRWAEALGGLDGVCLEESSASISSSTASPAPPPVSDRSSPLPSANLIPHQPPPPSQPKAATLPAHFSAAHRLNHDIGMIDPAESLGTPETRFEPYVMSASAIATNPSSQPYSGIPRPPLYSHHCLLPHPAPRGKAGGTVEPAKTLVKLRAKAAEAEAEEDAAVLRVVESFALATTPGTGAKATATAEIIVPEDERIMVETAEGDFEEKSLVDTVYAHQQDIESLRAEVAELRKALDREAKARRRAEAGRTTTPQPSLSPIPTPIH